MAPWRRARRILIDIVVECFASTTALKPARAGRGSATAFADVRADSDIEQRANQPVQRTDRAIHIERRCGVNRSTGQNVDP